VVRVATGAASAQVTLGHEDGGGFPALLELGLAGLELPSQRLEPYLHLLAGGVSFLGRDAQTLPPSQ
jgi:hypothetical protein